MDTEAGGSERSPETDGNAKPGKAPDKPAFSEKSVSQLQLNWEAAFNSPEASQSFSEEMVRIMAGLRADDWEMQRRGAVLQEFERCLLGARHQGGGSGRRSALARVQDLALKPFGSTAMGLSMMRGDLDVSLEGSIDDVQLGLWRLAGKGAEEKRKRLEKDLLRDVLGVIQRSPQLMSTTAAFGARIPVIKFKHLATAIECDISVGNSLGVLKSTLLGRVIGLDSRVSQLILWVKNWAKMNNINDSPNGTFNSYCLSLLVICFCQSRTPKILPPFSELFGDLGDTLKNAKEHGILSLLGRLEKKLGAWTESNKGFLLKNKETLFDLFINFLLLFQLLVSTVRQGGDRMKRIVCANILKGSFSMTAARNFFIVVEDPFELQSTNTARSLHTGGWHKVLEVSEKTKKAIWKFPKASQSLMALVAELLAPPQRLFSKRARWRNRDDGRERNQERGRRNGGLPIQSPFPSRKGNPKSHHVDGGEPKERGHHAPVPDAPSQVEANPGNTHTRGSKDSKKKQKKQKQKDQDEQNAGRNPANSRDDGKHKREVNSARSNSSRATKSQRVMDGGAKDTQPSTSSSAPHQNASEAQSQRRGKGESGAHPQGRLDSKNDDFPLLSHDISENGQVRKTKRKTRRGSSRKTKEQRDGIPGGGIPSPEASASTQGSQNSRQGQSTQMQQTSLMNFLKPDKKKRNRRKGRKGEKGSNDERLVETNGRHDSPESQQ